MAALIEQAALPFGFRFPLNRDDRRDCLLVASGYGKQEIKRIFEEAENVENMKKIYLAFMEAAKKLPFDELNRQYRDTTER